MANTIGKKYITDENGEKFYPIGHVGAIYDEDGNILGDMMNNGWGTKWYNGTAMSGTSSTAGAYYYSACPEVKVGDYYLNTSYGYVYECVTAGSGTTARWTYKCKLKGENGSSITGQRGSKWFTGTALSGTSSGTNYTWSDSEQKYVGDMYLNTSYGYVYKCTTAGTGTNAKWTYQGSIKGNDGRDASDYVDVLPIGATSSWKTVYRNGGQTFYVLPQAPTGGTIVLEGMGAERTTLKFSLLGAGEDEKSQTIIIKDCTVIMECPEMIYTSFVFINCIVKDGGNSNELYNGEGRLTFINSKICISASDSDPDDDRGCHSGIVTSSDVKIIGGSVTIKAGGTTYGYDANFIYSCNELTMQGVTISTDSSTPNGRINLIRNCNKATVNGCHIYLNGTMHSIGHIADTDRTVGGSFTGNYVEYYKTYMRFATISGNTFNHLAAGSSSSNQIVLQCPTNMSGNTFKGSAAYIDAQNQTVIVTLNMHKGLTVGPVSSGSIAGNNVLY